MVLREATVFLSGCYTLQGEAISRSATKCEWPLIKHIRYVTYALFVRNIVCAFDRNIVCAFDISTAYIKLTYVILKWIVLVVGVNHHNLYMFVVCRRAGIIDDPYCKLDSGSYVGVVLIRLRHYFY